MTASISSGQSSGSELICFLAIFAYFYLSHNMSQSSMLHWVPESAVVILLGLSSVGLMVGFHKDFLTSFDTALFFKILLPPIIFVSGFKMNLAVFYQNLTSIMVFANVGTVLNVVVFAFGMYGVGCGGVSTRFTLIEAMSYGSVVSATDPVTTIAVFDQLKVEPALYTIVVAVSILDDAVSIIMFDLFNGFINAGGAASHSVFYYVWFCMGQLLLIFVGSVLVGVAIALAFAVLVKHSKGLVDNPGLLHCMTICVVYAGYLTADLLTLSGIIASLCCGMVLQRYTALFVPQDSLKELTHIVGVLAQFFETMAFFLIGCALLQNTPSGGEDGAFVVWSLLLCVVSRAAQIYPLALLLNAYNKSQQPAGEATSETTIEGHSVTVIRQASGVCLSLGYQHLMMVAGLRGPVSFATSKLFPDEFGHQNLVAAATSLIVLSTIVVFGPLTEPMLHWCGIRHGLVTAAENDLMHPCSDEENQPSDDASGSSSSSSSDSSGAYIPVRGESSDEVVNALHNSGTVNSSSVTINSLGGRQSRVHCSVIWSWMEQFEAQYFAAQFLSDYSCSSSLSCCIELHRSHASPGTDSSQCADKLDRASHEMEMLAANADNAA